MSIVEQIESTLFYNDNSSNAFADLANEVSQAFARSQIRVQPKFTSETDLAFSVGELTLTVAFSKTPLDLTKFIKAKTPGTDFGLSQDVQRALVEHQSSIVIRVTGPATAALIKTRLAICYITTMQMISLAAPGHIHWAKSGSLYTYNQFFSHTGDTAPAHRRPIKADALLNAARSTRPASSVDWKTAINSQDHRLAMDSLRIDTLRRFVFSSSRIRTKRTATSMMRNFFSYAALSSFALLIGVSTLLSNLFTGLRLG